MSELLSLVSVNIERSKHLERVIPFLRDRHADVTCIQELMEYDVPLIEEAAGAPCFFVPTMRHPAEGRLALMGIGICSRSPIRAKKMDVYVEIPKGFPMFDQTSTTTKRATEGHVMLSCEIEKEGETFRVATTHFTWTPDGSADDYQRADVKKLLAILGGMGEFVLTGDFNAPRGGEIFGTLAEKYKDNVPSHYTTSIDGALHRAGPLELMVDGIFSTPGYAVSDVELVAGVSDHKAIVATVSSTD